MNSKEVYDRVSKVILLLADVNSKGYISDADINLFNQPIIKELLVLFGLKFKAYSKLKGKMHTYTPIIYK